MTSKFSPDTHNHYYVKALYTGNQQFHCDLLSFMFVVRFNEGVKAISKTTVGPTSSKSYEKYSH